VLKIQKQNKEYDVLFEHYKISNSRLVRERAHAILLSMKDRNVPDIADILLRGEDTIRDWIKAYQTTGVASVFPAYNDNCNASRLTPKQLAEIAQTLQTPLDSPTGLPSSFWSVKKLKSYIQAEYGVAYESDRSYHHIFAISNFSFKLPEGLDQRRNDELVEKRMKEIAEEIKVKQSENYEVFFADECSLAWETEYRRVWLPKGQKTVMRVNRNKTRQHYFGALNIQTKQEELIRLNWQNADNITEALRELTKRYPNQKLCIVWDNAMWHRSKQLRAMLGRTKDGQDNEFAHLHFIWMPPYAPDHNPQEHVWKVAKTETKNTITQTFEGLKQIFETAISGKIFDYTILRDLSGV
jgi:transposase